MTKKRKFKNDEEFKNFKLEDYLPSMNRREPKADTSVSGQEAAMKEEANLFPPLDEQDVMETSDTDEEMKDTPAGVEATAERTIVRRISSKQRRLSLDEYRATYLQVPKIADRKSVFVSREVRDGLDRIVRYLGGRGMSVSGLVENLARQHLAAYGNDIDQWRKL